MNEFTQLLGFLLSLFDDKETPKKQQISHKGIIQCAHSPKKSVIRRVKRGNETGDYYKKILRFLVNN